MFSSFFLFLLDAGSHVLYVSFNFATLPSREASNQSRKTLLCRLLAIWSIFPKAYKEPSRNRLTCRFAACYLMLLLLPCYLIPANGYLGLVPSITPPCPQYTPPCPQYKPRPCSPARGKLAFFKFLGRFVSCFDGTVTNKKNVGSRRYGADLRE